MRKIIIFEGHDKVGKSTIAKEVSKRYNIPVLKRTNINRSFDFAIDLLYGIEAYLQMLEQIEFSVIFDRLYPSEYAYSKVLKRYTSVEKIFDIDKRFAKLGTKIIFLHKDKSKYLPDEIQDMKIYEDINHEYNNFKLYTECNWLDIDTSDENLSEQMRKIINFI